MRVAIITDQHFGARNDSLHFLDFYEKLKEKKPVLIKTTPEYKAQLLEIQRANVRKAAETRAAKF